MHYIILCWRQKYREVLQDIAVCVLQFFFCHLAYQEAYHDTEAGIVHVLSSTSGLFTLILAAIFPSTSGDRITLSKLVAVAIR